MVTPTEHQWPSGQIDSTTRVSFCACGAVLAVIAETMLPEAFHEGGHYAGISCLAGFVATLVVAAVDDVFGAATRRALVLARPPGHLAEPVAALGFCLWRRTRRRCWHELPLLIS